MFRFCFRTTRRRRQLLPGSYHDSLTPRRISTAQSSMDDRIKDFLIARPSKYLYKHQPLVGDESFRLVDLPAGCGNDKVAVSLNNYRLSDAPGYEALSYIWGEDADVEYIQCNEKHVLPVTTSLVQVLRRFQLPDRSRKLWIDQCCIDQANTTERSSQVNMMPQIYSSAQSVVAWLGPDHLGYGPAVLQLLSQIDAAIDKSAILGERRRALRRATMTWDADVSIPGSKILYQLEQDMRLSASSFEGLQLPDYSSAEWFPLWSFFSCDYFKRLWVIQEVRLSRAVQLYWGQSELHWPLVHNAIRFCFFYRFVPEVDHDFYDSDWHTFVGGFYMGRDTTLRQLMNDTSAHKCADKRDKVFALLVFCRRIGDGYDDEADAGTPKPMPAVRADYTLTWPEVIQQTCKEICRQSRVLYLLCAIDHQTLPPPPARPSWVLEGPHSKFLYEFTWLHSQGDWGACGNTTPQLGSCESPGELSAKGLLVNRIVATTKPLQPHAKGIRDPEEFEHAWDLVTSTHLKNQESREVSTLSAERLVALLRMIETLCCDARYWRRESSEGAKMTTDQTILTDLYMFARHQITLAVGLTKSATILEQLPASWSQFFPEAGIQAAQGYALLQEGFLGTRRTSDSEVAEDAITASISLIQAMSQSSGPDEQETKAVTLSKAINTLRQGPPKPISANYSLMWAAGNRRFFVTPHGGMGIAPKVTRPGDQVVVIYGCPLPLVVRQREDGAYWLIGPCYLYGMMKGKAIEKREELGLQEMVFVFK